METQNQDKLIYNQITTLFLKDTPIKEIAHELNVSEVKVRRVLITEGYWSSPTSEEIMELHNAGKKPKQIAEELRKPLKTIQAYLPYSRGEYNDGEISEAAQQSKDFRKRNRDAKKRLVGVRRIDTQKKNLEENTMKEKHTEDTINIDTWRAETGYTGEGSKVLKLHLELRMDLNDEEEATLRKYGKSEKGISRDILVSKKMMLHNLHYAIQRAFGWQNSHLHHFAYPEGVFNALTEDKLPRFLNLCGIYYRFPEEENEDIYWDDDYDESVSPRTWLKRKYTAPYTYGGVSEYYLSAQTDAKAFRQQNPVLRIGPSFAEYMAGNKESKVKNIDDITVGEIRYFLETGVDELLERLPVGQVIGLKETEGWKDKVEEIAARADSSFAENYMKLNKLAREGKENEYIAFLKKTDPEVVPLSDTLLYYYDYGDDWIVEITCDEIYESFDGWNKKITAGYVIPADTDQQVFEGQIPFDSRGRRIEGELRDQIATVIAKGKPVCVSADGLPVMDDVGGPCGYCSFLNGIHGQDCGGYDYTDKDETKEWGRGMGWTGKMHRPENIL